MKLVKLAMPWWLISLYAAAMLLADYYIWAAYTYHPVMNLVKLAMIPILAAGTLVCAAAWAGEPRLALPWWRISLYAVAMLLVVCYIWAAYTYDPIVLRHPHPFMSNQDNIAADFGWPSDVPRARDLTPQEKVTILASSLEDSSSDDANLRIAEAAAASPSENSDQNAAGKP
jgi:hypothetical protein